jgi:SAM-dependent methyltransferase
MSNYSFHSINRCPFCNANNFRLLGKRLNASQGFSPHKKTGVSVSVVKCKNCGLVVPQPLPVPLSIEDHYKVPPETYWKPEFFKVNEIAFDGLNNQMNSIQKMKPGSKILDIGAGFGRAMVAMEKKGYDVYGIEPSEAFYDKAVNEMGVPKDKLKLSTVEDCCFEEGFFDVVLFVAVLEHLYHPAEMLMKAMKWLKPGGLMFVEVPSSRWLIAKMVNFQYRLRGKDYVINLSPMHEPYHLYEFTHRSFQIHAQNNHYEIADYHYYICSTFMPSFLNPLIIPIMKKTKTGMELGLWLRKQD